MNIVFMGTPDFAVPSLLRLIEDGHNILAVYTQPDKPQGRKFILTPPAVKEAAILNKIEVFQPDTLKSPQVKEQLKSLSPDLIVVAAYGKILPKDILEIPAKGCINVHGSLLPKYRGAAPIQWAVINGEKTSGVTIMQMAEGLDTGDILLKSELEIGEDETAGELFDRIATLGADALSKTVSEIDNIKPVSQEEALATWAPPLKKQDGLVDWAQSAEAVYSRIRGITPWPGAYTLLNDERKVKIHKARLLQENGSSGELLDKKRLIIGCGENSLELTEVQLDGAKKISGEEFIRGQRLTPGTLFKVN